MRNQYSKLKKESIYNSQIRQSRELQMMQSSFSKQSKIKSSLRLKSKTPLEKDQIHKINTILMHLNNHNDSLDFREPVDWKNLELYDYLQVVKHPMDLGTVNTKLRDKKYKTVEAVLNDVQLIWDNCKLYNSKGSEIYELADKLQLSFRRMIKNYLPNLKVATVTSAPARPMTEPPFTITYKPDREQIKPTQYMKKDFVVRISQLTQEQLEQLINCVKNLSSKSFIEGQDGWARIQVEQMNQQCFIKSYGLLTKLLNRKSTQHM